MKLLVFILNKTEALDGFLNELARHHQTGATIVSSKGMMRSVSDQNELSFLGPLRAILDPDREDNKTILLVVKDEAAVANVRECIRNTVGDLSRPDTGILFTVPVDYVEGIQF
jgi:hypothetical protein